MAEKSVRTKSYQIRMTEKELKRWKDAAIDQRYMKLSEFIRDAVEEKILRFQENR